MQIYCHDTSHQETHAYHDALRIAAAPRPTDTVSLRLLAWSALKAQRNQTTRQCRLIAMQRAAQ